MEMIYIVTVMDGADFSRIGARRAFKSYDAALAWGEDAAAKRNTSDEYKVWYIETEKCELDGGLIIDPGAV